MKRKASKKIAFWGIMTALTITLSFLEGMIDIPIAMPGAKLGLANVVVVSASMISGFYAALYICIVKSLFVLATRGATAFILSLSGGLLSGAVTVISLKYLRKYLSLIGISILSAFCHNLAQLISAIIIMKTGSLIYYLPMLAIFSLVFGSVTGAVMIGIEPYISKHFSEREGINE